MLTYNLIEYSDNYSKLCGSLYQLFKDEPLLNNADIAESESSKFKSILSNNISAAVTINVEIPSLLKYSNNFWRTFEIPLINCEINVILI